LDHRPATARYSPPLREREICCFSDGATIPTWTRPGGEDVCCHRSTQTYALEAYGEHIHFAWSRLRVEGKNYFENTFLKTLPQLDGSCPLL
jgi:hypothetical protein